MGSADEREIDASRNRRPEGSNSQPRSSPQLDIDKRSSEQPENARQKVDRADARDSIHRNARFCKQEGQRGEVEAINHSEGQNEQAEDPGRRSSALNRHVQRSLAKSLSQEYRKGEHIKEKNLCSFAASTRNSTHFTRANRLKDAPRRAGMGLLKCPSTWRDLFRGDESVRRG